MSHLKSALFVIFGAIVIVSSAHAEDPGAHAKKIAGYLDSVYGNCSSRIWPAGYGFEKMQGIFLDTEAQRAWLWNGQPGHAPLVEIAYTNLPESTRGFPYGFAPYQSAQTTSIFTNFDWGTPRVTGSDITFEVFVHESFHHFEQASWNTHDGARSAPYPFDWRPRYLRRQLLNALVQTVLEPAKAAQSFLAARYWQDLFEKENPAIVTETSVMDILEGTATYAEVMAGALSQRGCDSDESAIFDLLALNPKNLFATYHVKNPTIPGLQQGEFYDIGLAASLLLRERDTAGWELQVMNGNSPVKLLLQSWPAEPQADDPALVTYFQNLATESNAKFAPELDPLISGLHSLEPIRLVIPRAWLTGGFSATGMVNLKDAPQGTAFLGFSAHGSSPQTQSSFEFRSRTVFDIDQSPCPGQKEAIVAIFKSGDLPANGPFQINASSFQANGEVESVVDAQGLTWTCLKP